PEALFDLTLDVVVGADGGVADFRGAYVQGTRGARFLYLSWGQIAEASEFAMFARVKCHCPRSMRTRSPGHRLPPRRVVPLGDELNGS
ncbi:MAG: DUF5990 family protein, partial [Chloroflexota bacterium]|nr:DUF5990 family protein [Chloroflexota bacterium]